MSTEVDLAERPEVELAPAPEPTRRSRRQDRPARPPRAARPRPPARVRPPVPRGAAVASTALLVLGALAAWAVLQLVVLGGLSEARAQQTLYAELRQALARQIAPLGGEIAPGTPVALLKIPTIGLEQVVVEGTASGDLQAGPGHRRDSALPGQAGVSLLYGKALTYGAPFRSITQLREGDGITVTTAQGEFTYRVDQVRRQGDLTLGTLGKGEGRLTLVTMEGTGPLAAISPSRTVYVDATLVGDAAVGAGRLSGVPPAEKALGVDTGALPLLVLLLQALLLATAATTWLRGRQRRPVVWVLTTPILVVCAWLVLDTASRLLPNLL